jgi:hypothetical protein
VVELQSRQLEIDRRILDILEDIWRSDVTENIKHVLYGKSRTKFVGFWFYQIQVVAPQSHRQLTTLLQMI